MAAAARGAADGTERGGCPGLVAGGHRQLACAGGERRPETGPSPVDRARPGSKHHVITEAHGIPLAVSLTGGNRNDVTQLMPLIEAIPPVRGRRGPPAPPPGEGLRRPRLRPRQVPQAGPGCRHHARDRPPQHGTWLGPGRAPMGGGTDGRAAALVPPAAHPLGNPRRYPRSLPQPRLRHHLLAPPTQPRTLLGPLSTHLLTRWLGRVQRGNKVRDLRSGHRLGQDAADLLKLWPG